MQRRQGGGTRVITQQRPVLARPGFYPAKIQHHKDTLTRTIQNAVPLICAALLVVLAYSYLSPVRLAPSWHEQLNQPLENGLHSMKQVVTVPVSEMGWFWSKDKYPAERDTLLGHAKSMYTQAVDEEQAVMDQAMDTFDSVMQEDLYDQPIAESVDHVKEGVEHIKEGVKEAAEGIKETVGHGIDMAREEFIHKQQEVKESLEHTMEAMKIQVGATKAQIAGKYAEVKDKLVEETKAWSEAAKARVTHDLDIAKEIVNEKATEAREVLHEKAEEAKEVIAEAKETITEKAEEAREKAVHTLEVWNAHLRVSYELPYLLLCAGR
eukprot:TRINITY_DN6643_c0_g1_i3.p1 TRINITY_DN6643_c0_g1~~TRINITY_DN6643_c0_g1_i3.p1  ORF type:complete len:323 (-),score=99.37 TRINITY_DN6643_c0_g1_i3:420-1388(-)